MTYQVKYGHLHFALVEIRRLVLDYLHGAYVVCPHVLTLDDLAKSALTENIQDEIPASSADVQLAQLTCRLHAPLPARR